MPFFAPQDQTPEQKADETFARRLYAALLDKRKLVGKSSVTSWVPEVAKLRRDVGPIRMTNVLDWYVHHIGEEYIPKAFSAKAFRQKFPSLEEAYQRSGAVSAKVVVSDSAKALAKRMGLQWPNDEKADELACIQQSLDNYRQFQEKLMAFCREQRAIGMGDPKLFRLASHLLVIDRSPVHFVENWMHDLHKMAWSWEKWKGKLMRWVFRQDSPKFESHLKVVTTKYCGDPSRWQQLKDMLLK